MAVLADIEKGARWAPDISDRLEEAKVGIVCLASDNLDAPWILFEAGALAKTKEARLCTLLLDVKKSTVQPPLSQFQATLFEKNDVRKLVETIAHRVQDVGEKAPSDEVLSKAFDRFWPDLEERVTAIRATRPTMDGPTRKPEEILDEILVTVRRLENERRKEIMAEVVAGLRTEVLAGLRAAGQEYDGSMTTAAIHAQQHVLDRQRRVAASTYSFSSPPPLPLTDAETKDKDQT